MLISVAVENYRSIREKITLDLTPNRAIKDFKGNKIYTHLDELPDLLRSIAIYGTNGSGKTNFLRSINVMRDFILESARDYSEGDLIPVEPFLLDSTYSSRPTTFEIEFLLTNVRYSYAFSCTAQKILHEVLYVFPKGVKQLWFERIFHSSQNEYSWKFGSNFKGEKSDTKERTLENTLFFSKAVMDNHEQLKPINEYFREKIFVNPGRITQRHTYELVETPEGKEQILNFLKAADLGIDDIIVKTKEIDSSDFPEELRQNIKQKYITFDTKSIHKIPGTNEAVEFNFSTNEFTGTNKLFFLSGLIIKTLLRGGVLFIDELENSLHCRLLSFLLDMFNKETSNPLGAQLVFSTHAPSVLDNNFLRRDQIWFTNKTPLKNTILYSLADVAKHIEGAKPVRKGQDLTKGFLEGRFYSPPNIDTQLSFFKELENHDQNQFQS